MTGYTLLAHLQDVSLRSLILASLAFLLLLPVWGRRGAAASHAVWSAVLAGMLLLFAAGPVFPAITLRVLADAAPQAVAPAPFRREIAFFIYAAVAAVMLMRVAAGCWILRALARSGVPVDPSRALYESAAIVVPLTVGWIRPRILLPAGWQSWDQRKLDAVLTHEDQHIRRRDSLVALLAAINRSILWFHPLAWWLERKLALLAEQACDDACIRALGDRRRYAQLLVEMAGAVEASHGRVIRHALAMAKPSHIRRRIDTILDPARRPGARLSYGAWAAVVASSIPAIYATAAVKLAPRPALLALPPRIFTPAAPPLAATAPQHAAAPHTRNSAEARIAEAIHREPDPQRKLSLLNSWKAKYPNSAMARERLQLYLNTYSQLNDVPNLLAALNQMGKEASVNALEINPGRADAYFSPAARSQTLFYYARAATYEGPGSLAAESRQQLEEYLRKVYRSYYGENEVGLNELKNLAKSMPFPPQAFLISVLPPPNRSYVASLSAASSSLHIRNNCPYGLRLECSGPERKRTWIPSGGDSQLVLAAGTYEIYAADALGVSSFNGPGRFDPQFKYDYTLSVVR